MMNTGKEYTLDEVGVLAPGKTQVRMRNKQRRRSVCSIVMLCCVQSRGGLSGLCLRQCVTRMAGVGIERVTAAAGGVGMVPHRSSSTRAIAMNAYAVSSALPDMHFRLW